MPQRGHARHPDRSWLAGLLAVLMLAGFWAPLAAQAAATVLASCQATANYAGENIQVTWRTTQERVSDQLALERTTDNGAVWDTLHIDYTDGAPKTYQYTDSWQESGTVVGYRVSVLNEPLNAGTVVICQVAILALTATPTPTATPTLTPTWTATSTPTATATRPVAGLSPTPIVSPLPIAGQTLTPLPAARPPVAPGATPVATPLPAPATFATAPAATATPRPSPTPTPTRTPTSFLRRLPTGAVTPGLPILSSDTAATAPAATATVTPASAPLPARALVLFGVAAAAIGGAALLGAIAFVLWRRAPH